MKSLFFEDFSSEKENENAVDFKTKTSWLGVELGLTFTRPWVLDSNWPSVKGLFFLNSHTFYLHYSTWFHNFHTLSHILMYGSNYIQIQHVLSLKKTFAILLFIQKNLIEGLRQLLPTHSTDINWSTLALVNSPTWYKKAFLDQGLNGGRPDRERTHMATLWECSAMGGDTEDREWCRRSQEDDTVRVNRQKEIWVCLVGWWWWDVDAGWKQASLVRATVYGENSRGWAERYWDQKRGPSRLCSLNDWVTWAIWGWLFHSSIMQDSNCPGGRQAQWWGWPVEHGCRTFLEGKQISSSLTGGRSHTMSYEWARGIPRRNWSGDKGWRGQKEMF